MIREYKSGDFAALAQVIDGDILIDKAPVMNDIRQGPEKILVYEKGRIKGFAYAKLVDTETKRYDVQIYVEPGARRNGIGMGLYQEIDCYLNIVKPNLITASAAVDNNDPGPFYRKLGFKRWYCSIDMQYNDGPQPQVGLEIENYRDKHFEQYVRIVSDSFYQLHKDNDIQPYKLPADSEYWQQNLRRRDCIYLALDAEQIMAATVFSDGCLEFLVVSPPYQGRGLGKQTAQFAINKLLEQGASLIHTSVVRGNQRAEDLYKSLGFTVVRTNQVYRQFGHR